MPHKKKKKLRFAVASDANILRRYTDLPALIHLLRSRAITFLDPATWDDKNDSYYMGLYKDRFGLDTVLALCFTLTAETYHHWRIFAGGAGGICVHFKREKLLSCIQTSVDVRAASVRYFTIKQNKANRVTRADLPFVKRWAFANEQEFRIVYESKVGHQSYRDVPIDLAAIDQISLSPWMHPSLDEDVRTTIRSIDGCAGVKIVRSTLISNEKWKRLGEAAI